MSLETWTQGLIDGVTSFIENVQATLGELITSLQDTWDTFETETLPSIWATIDAKVIDLTAAIAAAAVTLTSAIDTVAADLVTALGTVAANLTSAITQALSDAHDDAVALIAEAVPSAFIKDPWGYLQAAFTTFIDSWVLGVVGDLAEGLIAGATMEEPGIHGAGESFMQGFNSVINEEED